MELAVATVEAETLDLISHRQLAMWLALRRLGFESDEIFVQWADGPRTVLKVEDKIFSVSYPESTVAESDWLEEWTTQANYWNSQMSDEDRERMYRRHVSNDVMLVLALTLKSQGFRIRGSEN